MIKTASPEVVTAKVHDKAYWEKKGVRFKQTETIGISLSGSTSNPYLTWSAYYKKKYLTGGGGTSLDGFIEWMNKKHDMIIGRMQKIDSGKY